MPRNTQFVEIPLRDGVISNESLYVIGPRLWKATNSVFDYRYPRLNGSATGPFGHRQPLTFAVRGTSSYTGMKSFRDIGFNNNATFPGSNHVTLIGTNTSNQYAAWQDNGGSEISFGGGVSRVTIAATKQLGSSVYWQTPGNNPASGSPTTDSVLIFGHHLAGQIYYLFDGAGSIQSLSSDTTNCPKSGAALTLHLDRLWILTNADSSNSYWAGKSQVWYTDPFNLDSIRSTSVIQIPDLGTALIPGQFGVIDASGVPHLIIGGMNSVWVLDGDPQLGGGLQADLRVLDIGVGISSPHAAAVTPYGVFFLGTDGDLWHIPPGCQSMAPVGASVRNQLGINNVTGTLDDYVSGGSLTPRGSVVWFDPYLYIFPAGETTHALIARPTDARGSLEWWGPVTMNSTITGREAVIRSPQQLFGPYANSTLAHLSLHSVDMLPVSGATARYLVCDTLSAGTGSYPDGIRTNRTASVQTGFYNVPGHEVELRRVILETLKVPQISSADVDWTVTATDEKGTTVTGSRGLLANGSAVPPPTSGTYAQGVIATQQFTFAHAPLPAARGISVRIAATAGADLALQRAFAEFHVTPAQR